MFVSGFPGLPGHSFCANSPQRGNAPCGRFVSASVFASLSAQDSPAVQRVSGGRPFVFRYSLIVLKHSSWSVPPLAVTPPLEPSSSPEEPEEPDDPLDDPVRRDGAVSELPSSLHESSANIALMTKSARIEIEG